ncbi:MAG: virulence factor SrfB, partial [Pseudomonadota bacterium]
RHLGPAEQAQNGGDAADDTAGDGEAPADADAAGDVHRARLVWNLAIAALRWSALGSGACAGAPSNRTRTAKVGELLALLGGGDAQLAKLLVSAPALARYADAVLRLDDSELSQVITTATEAALRPVFNALYEFECDDVLLTGWVARLPAVRSRVASAMGGRPDRVLSFDHDTATLPFGPPLPTAPIADHAGLQESALAITRPFIAEPLMPTAETQAPVRAADGTMRRFAEDSAVTGPFVLKPRARSEEWIEEAGSGRSNRKRAGFFMRPQAARALGLNTNRENLAFELGQGEARGGLGAMSQMSGAGRSAAGARGARGLSGTGQGAGRGGKAGAGASGFGKNGAAGNGFSSGRDGSAGSGAGMMSRGPGDDPSSGFQTWSFQCDLPAVLEFASVLSHEWPTSPAYLLQFKARSNLGAVRLPVTITIQTSHHLDENVQYRITEAKDANDVIIPPETLELRLQTLPDRRGYWLDTGQLPAPPS